MPEFPYPNDVIEGQGIVVASCWYREDIHLATILVLRPEAPFFRVGVWNFKYNVWDGDHYEDHYNIVPAVKGEKIVVDNQFTGEKKWGYWDFGGDY